MALFGIAPDVMKPTALTLNLLVAAIGTFQAWRTGLFSWRTFYPFAVLGLPFSLLGGAVHLPTRLYYPAVGVILLLSAIQMFRIALRKGISPKGAPHQPPFLPALLTGAVIGFVSGTTGTGGGIFLAPVILAMNWIDLRRTTSVTAAYNLLNSAAALAGASGTLGSFPAALPVWALAVICGGVAGTIIGSRFMPEGGLRLILGAVLLVSGVKLVLT